MPTRERAVLENRGWVLGVLAPGLAWGKCSKMEARVFVKVV